MPISFHLKLLLCEFVSLFLLPSLSLKHCSSTESVINTHFFSRIAFLVSNSNPSTGHSVFLFDSASFFSKAQVNQPAFLSAYWVFVLDKSIDIVVVMLQDIKELIEDVGELDYQMPYVSSILPLILIGFVYVLQLYPLILFLG